MDPLSHRCQSRRRHRRSGRHLRRRGQCRGAAGDAREPAPLHLGGIYEQIRTSWSGGYQSLGDQGSRTSPIGQRLSCAARSGAVRKARRSRSLVVIVPLVACGVIAWSSRSISSLGANPIAADRASRDPPAAGGRTGRAGSPAAAPVRSGPSSSSSPAPATAPTATARAERSSSRRWCAARRRADDGRQ